MAHIYDEDVVSGAFQVECQDIGFVSSVFDDGYAFKTRYVFHLS